MIFSAFSTMRSMLSSVELVGGGTVVVGVGVGVGVGDGIVVGMVVGINVGIKAGTGFGTAVGTHDGARNGAGWNGEGVVACGPAVGGAPKVWAPT